jgi:hypothetical protein
MRRTMLALLLSVSWNVWGQTSAKNTTNSYPVIVARVTRTNQTDWIPPTAIATPKQAKLYRVSYYLDCGGQNLEWVIRLYWVDANGNQALGGGPCTGPNNPSFGAMIVRATAGSTLRYATTGVAGHYDLFLTVERLN